MARSVSDHVYIRVPGPNGGEDVYVPVDTDRLSSGYFRALWMRVKEHDRGAKYKPAHGYEHLLDRAPDMREVLTALNEGLENTLSVLADADVNLATEAQGAFDKLGALVHAVNLGNQEDAVHIAREIGWLIVGATGKAVEMHRGAVEAKVQAIATYEVVAGVHNVREELDTNALQHAESADNLLKAFDELERTRATLRAKRDAFQRAFQAVRAACSESTEPWASAWQFLGEGDDSFSTRVFDYQQMESDLDETARADIEEARHHLTACDERFQALKAEQSASLNLQAVFKLTEDVATAGTRYQQANAAFRKHMNRIGEDVVRRGLLSRAEYDRAKNLHERSPSDLDECARETRALEHECSLCADAKTLTLSDRLVRALDETRAFLASLETQEAAPLAPPWLLVEPPADEAITPPDKDDEEEDDGDAAVTQPNPKAPKPVLLLPGDSELAATLYELVICVGSFRRDAPQTSSFKSLYRCAREVLVERRVAPREDIERVYRLAQALSRETGERHALGKKDSFPVEAQRKMARATQDATWLSWKARFPSIRLTAQGQRQAEDLMRKHNLTEAELTRAWRTARDKVVQAQKDYQARKKGTPPTEAPATP